MSNEQHQTYNPKDWRITRARKSLAVNRQRVRGNLAASVSINPDAAGCIFANRRAEFFRKVQRRRAEGGERKTSLSSLHARVPELRASAAPLSIPECLIRLLHLHREFERKRNPSRELQPRLRSTFEWQTKWEGCVQRGLEFARAAVCINWYWFFGEKIWYARGFIRFSLLVVMRM